MNHGDTFLADLTGSDHLWVVLSDPLQDAEHVVLVSVRTWHEHFPEDCCVIEKGEHPFAEHRSCVDFRFARATSLATINQLRKAPKDPMPKPILERILKAADESYDIPGECREIIINQGFIDAF